MTLSAGLNAAKETSRAARSLSGSHSHRTSTEPSAAVITMPIAASRAIVSAGGLTSASLDFTTPPRPQQTEQTCGERRQVHKLNQSTRASEFWKHPEDEENEHLYEPDDQGQR